MQIVGAASDMVVLPLLPRNDVGGGNRHGEFGALVHAAFDRDAPALTFANGFANRQPDARTVDFGARMQAREGVENRADIAGVDPATIVLEAQQELAFRAPSAA